MPEVKKRKIVLASVLKPTDDTRMTEKIAQSLLSIDNTEIHIIGYPGNNISDSRFKIHPLDSFSRLSLKRLLAPWKIFRKVLQLRPALYVVTTHELLVEAIVVKLFTGCKVIYDIQENYYLNILHTNAFPVLLRPFIAGYVRLKEYITAPFIDHFFLAEAGYTKELRFPGRRFTILENKVKCPINKTKTKREKYKLLFSGTLAKTTGVFKAIEIASLLHALEPKISLVIIGYAAQQSVQENLRSLACELSFIELIGIDQLVPHDKIVEQIQTAAAGIIAYPDNPVSRSSIPTKLYEYLGYELPIILTDHPLWKQICEPYHAALVFNPLNIDAQVILRGLTDSHFYPTTPQEVYWEGEHSKLISEVNRLLQV